MDSSNNSLYQPRKKRRISSKSNSNKNKSSNNKAGKQQTSKTKNDNQLPHKLINKLQNNQYIYYLKLELVKDYYLD